MQLIGQAIRHDTFGKGIVTDWDEKVLTVCFPVGDKKFIYPDAFAHHLTLKNSAAQQKIQSLLDAQAAKKEAAHQALQKRQERKHFLAELKISPNAQAAFHLTGEQETALFSQWTVSTGTYLSGYSKGEPRVPDRLKPNSMCLLTRRDPGTPERSRRIIGLFMVEELFLGSQCRDGVVKAHPLHRLVLPAGEQPLFWPYFTQDPARQRWGNTALKYFSNQTGEAILLDLLERGGSPERQALLRRFYQYFCTLNRLPPREAGDGPCT